jgi:hypothetical protein
MLRVSVVAQPRIRAEHLSIEFTDTFIVTFKFLDLNDNYGICSVSCVHLFTTGALVQLALFVCGRYRRAVISVSVGFISTRTVLILVPTTTALQGIISVAQLTVIGGGGGGRGEEVFQGERDSCSP